MMKGTAGAWHVDMKHVLLNYSGSAQGAKGCRVPPRGNSKSNTKSEEWEYDTSENASTLSDNTK